MVPKKKPQDQGEMFRSNLRQILNPRHEMYVLAETIQWRYFQEEFGALYSQGMGRPGLSTRLMVGLHYLKHAFNESDESVVERFLENPYWQFFCGFEYFQHKLPLDPTSLVKWRKRVGSAGIEKLLKGTIETAKTGKLIKRVHLKKVNVDTTVQEKAIAFPTDARLYEKMRKALVREALKNWVELRQSYKRLGKKALQKQGRYSHARQMKRSARETRKLKTYLGCVVRDIRRKGGETNEELRELLNFAERLLNQKRKDKNKLYSVHAPEVECISKGKVHKRYEFGNKVSVVSTSKDNWVVGMVALHGNPYDGHTLKGAMEQTEKLTGKLPEEAYCDRGYRGAGKLCKEVEVHLSGKKGRSRSFRKWLKRRSAIEPIIGHLKSDNRMNRNYLKGTEGDRANAMLSGCGYNIRKLLRAFFSPFFRGLLKALGLASDQHLSYRPLMAA